jgi:hypothetical protein
MKRTRTIEALDCLCFNSHTREEKVPDNVMRKFINARHQIISSNPDEYLASYDFNNEMWVAGRYIGECVIKDEKFSYHIIIKPRFGVAILGELLYDLFKFKALKIRF